MLDQHEFHYIESWQCMEDEDAEEVRLFWLKEGTNVQGHTADERVRQIVLRVVNDDGELAAVSTAEPRVIPRLMQPMYYFRCHVGAAWRAHRLIQPLLLRSFDVLEQWAHARDFPCIGLLLELENPAFRATLQRAHWHFPGSTGYTFIGRSPRGFDLRVCYFQGAELKQPHEVEALTYPAVD